VKDRKISVAGFDARLAKTYRHGGDKRRHYDDWASRYEADLVDDLDYVAFRAAGEIFVARLSDRQTPVLDVACGTGLAGDFLSQNGFTTIDGADFSGAMLAVAKRRGIYRDLWQHDFTRARIPEPGYAALICVGLFAFSEPGIDHLHHVVDCVEPGGLCVITVNGAAWRQLDLEPRVRQAAREHGFVVEEIIVADYIRSQGIDARVLVIRR
jgi:predicted TPR repeat methyltransferase